MMRVNLLAVFLFVLAGCAIISLPEGGDKDVSPPNVVSTYPDSAQTLFKGRTISLTFDEYVTIRDLQNQLIISPPLEKPYKFNLSKRTLRIELNEDLKDSTTYQFNFGSAISDLNEGNKLNNFVLVFATGTSIDSSTLSGNVSHIADETPAKNALVMLYRQYDDSNIVKSKPYYITRTNDSGTFMFRHLQNDSFQIVALEDGNNNYHFDVKEKVGFISSYIRANQGGIHLDLFDNQYNLPFQIRKTVNSRPGRFSLVMNQPLPGTETKPVIMVGGEEVSKTQIYLSSAQDTVHFFYPSYRTLDSLEGECIINDTLRLPFMIRKRSDKAPPNGKWSDILGSIDPDKPISVYYSSPIGKLDTPALEIIADSAVLEDYTLEINSPFEVQIDGSFTPGKKYTLILKPGLVTDLFDNRSRPDTIEIVTKDTRNYGTLSFSVTFTDSIKVKQGTLQLVKDKRGVMEFYVQSDTTLKLTYIQPGTYSFRFYHDINGNKRWDSGNILAGIHPEPIRFLSEITDIKANWDIENIHLIIK